MHRLVIQHVGRLLENNTMRDIMQLGGIRASRQQLFHDFAPPPHPQIYLHINQILGDLTEDQLWHLC